MVAASKPSRVEMRDLDNRQSGPTLRLPDDVVAMVVDAGCEWIFGPEGPPGRPGGGGPEGPGGPGGPPPGNDCQSISCCNDI